MAHKKGVGSSRNGRDSQSKRLGVKGTGDRLSRPAIYLSGRGAQSSIPGPMSAREVMTLFMPGSAAL